MPSAFLPDSARQAHSARQALPALIESPTLQITLKTTGGIAYFPGLSAPRTVDVSTLDAERQRQINDVLGAVRFFDLPSRAPARRGAADYQTHTITVTDGDRQHTVEVTDPLSPEFERFITLLRDALRG